VNVSLGAQYDTGDSFGYLGTIDAHDLTVQTNSSERMRITSGGNVGIGTTTPHSKLAVVGLPVYANNAAAITGGLATGDFYQDGGNPSHVCVVQ
jgi:hypothetical protein